MGSFIKKKICTFDIVNTMLLSILACVIFIPFYNAILVSLMTTKEYASNKLALFPHEVTFDAYRVIFTSGWVATGYKNSIFIAIIGVMYSLLINTLCAYGFSNKSFPGKNLLMTIFIFTMFFGGGLIPFYLLIKSLGLGDTLWSVILPTGMSVFYMLLIKGYFENIDEGIKESAKLDGANEIVLLFKIMLPLSLPILATVALFIFVDLWNAWFGAMLFIDSASKKPLQLSLREIINPSSTRITHLLTNDMIKVQVQSVQMAAVVVTMAPIMFIYPFLQKHFVKGIMIGAIKG